MTTPKDLKSRLTDNIYYENQYRNTLESCINLIRQHPDTRVADVDEYHARIYERDFYTYLLHVNVPTESHWVIMRVNYMLSPFDFTRNIKKLYIPSENFIMNTRRAVNETRRLDDF